VHLKSIIVFNLLYMSQTWETGGSHQVSSGANGILSWV